MPGMQSRIQLCRTTDVENGGALKVETAGLALAVFNVDGEFFVIDDACTHGPGSLSEGYLHGDVIECNFHGGQFNVRTGEVMSPPCLVPVKIYAVTVEQGMILIDAPETV
jgi:nitrite reductase/ring-hydroxylating ferredoxin subunit